MDTTNGRADTAARGDRRTFLGRLLALGGAVGAMFFARGSQAQTYTVQPMLPPRGEFVPPRSGDRMTTQALGEEGGNYTTRALGEEGGGPVTTQAVGEEGGPGGGWYTTQALGEEGAGPPRPRPPRYYRYTTYALGEEGSYAPPPRRPVYHYYGPPRY